MQGKEGEESPRVSPEPTENNFPHYPYYPYQRKREETKTNSIVL